MPPVKFASILIVLREKDIIKARGRNPAGYVFYEKSAVGRCLETTYKASVPAVPWIIFYMQVIQFSDRLVVTVV